MDSLTELGGRHGTDKVEHGFLAFYDQHLGEIRDSVRKVLEIGVFGGASLRMWRDYFPNAEVHGLDTEPPVMPDTDRIRLHAGDQGSRLQLNRLIAAAGANFDLIVDDGGHTMPQQQISLACLLPHVRPGGHYVIEDLHTSFTESVSYYQGGRLVRQVPTGAVAGGWTTFRMVEALASGKPSASEYMSLAERVYVDAHATRVEIFDRDSDRQHVTSIMEKRLD